VPRTSCRPRRVEVGIEDLPVGVAARGAAERDQVDLGRELSRSLCGDGAPTAGDESTDPLPFTNGPFQDLIGYLSVTIAPGFTTPAVIMAAPDATFTALSNQAGTITETFANQGLNVEAGSST